MFDTQVPLYGIFIIISFICGLFVVYVNTKRFNFRIEEIISLLIFVVLGAIFGAKYYTFLANPKEFNGVFNFEKVGLSSYGAVIGIIILLIVFSKLYKKSFKHLILIMLPSIPLMYGIGKIGCFFAGCCYGIETNSWLGVKFPEMDHKVYPTQLFEALFSDIVCSYGGHSCEKVFFDMDGSAGIGQDLASATARTKGGVERYGLGYYTGKVSNAAKINSAIYHEKVYKDMNVILTNAQIVSDLITEAYKSFNIWFTDKYSKLIGTDNCMVDGDEFRKQLLSWIASQSSIVKEELKIVDEMILDIIKASKNGKLYYQAKKVVK